MLPTSSSSSAAAEPSQPPGYMEWVRCSAWRAWMAVDGAVAWASGLDESKYQWAVDRYHRQQAELALVSNANDGDLASSDPHEPPPSKVMRADAENPRGAPAAACDY